MRRTLILMAAATGLAAATPALADEWSDQVQTFIDSAADTYLSQGYHYGGFSHEGSLNNGATEELTIRIGGGRETQLIGVCDTDCSDLDLTLYDANGKEIDSDLELDDFPIISTSANRDAVYTVKVSMVSCSTEPCRYAVQPFVK